MVRAVAAVLAAASLAALCQGAVVDLTTSEDFDQAIQATDVAFVEFYAPWCGHCKKLAPVWDQLAESLGDSGVQVAKVDATVASDAAARFGVTGFPTLLLFAEGKFVKYDGGRSLASLEDFAKGGFQARLAAAASMPPAPPAVIKATPGAPSLVQDLSTSTAAQLDAAVERAPKGLFIEFYAPWCGHCKSLAPIWEDVAATLVPRDIPVAKVDATVNTAASARFGVTGFPTLKFLVAGRVFSYRSARSASALVAFATGGWRDAGEGEAYPPAPEEPEAPQFEEDAPGVGVVDLTDSNFEHLTQAATGATTGPWFIKFYAPWCGHCKAMAPAWTALAGELAGAVNVAQVDCTANRATCRRFGVKSYPGLLLVDRGRVWDYAGARDVSTITAWLETGRADAPSSPVPGVPGLGAWAEAQTLRAARDLKLVWEHYLGAGVVLVTAGLLGGMVLMMGIVMATEPSREGLRAAVRAEMEMEAMAVAATRGQQAEGGEEEDADTAESKKDQ